MPRRPLGRRPPVVAARMPRRLPVLNRSSKPGFHPAPPICLLPVCLLPVCLLPVCFLPVCLLLEQRPDVGPDRFVEMIDGVAPIQTEEALRFGICQTSVRVGNAAVKAMVFRFHTVVCRRWPRPRSISGRGAGGVCTGRVCTGRSRTGRSRTGAVRGGGVRTAGCPSRLGFTRGQLDQVGPIRYDALRHPSVQAIQPVRIRQLAAASLVGGGRIVEAVAQNDAAGLQSGPDAVGNELCTGSREQKHLGKRVDGQILLKQKRSDPLRQLGPAGLADEKRIAAPVAEVSFQKASLGTFATAVNALEGKKKHKNDGFVQRVETMEIRGAVGLRLSAWLQRTPRRGSVPVGWRSVGPVRPGWGRGSQVVDAAWGAHGEMTT